MTDLDAFSIPALCTTSDDARGRALMGEQLRVGHSELLGRA